MAAKVAIVAVPTVLGLASIRVYTVSEAPTDGLITREKLNIYTPLPQTAQPQFVPEPGVIETGLTTVREGVQPFVQAVKGACVSVKTGSVNLYHAGEDVYYYLKDPPPGFLPRFGTITMAGLLGMFLARKGSRFKRVAVPMGLMSAGASVCYPAQAVAVLKVTGKKVYAAGQWSSTAMSSLLTSKPVTKEIAASEPQGAPVPNPESAEVKEASEADSVQSSTIPETEVESAVSSPVSDEPSIGVVTDEVSSVTLTEISPEQTTTETNTDPVAQSVPTETETNTTSEKIPPPVDSEPSNTQQAAEDVGTAEPMPSLEAAPVESAPVESAPVEAAPVEAAPVEAAPVEAVPSSEKPPSPKASDESAVVESADPEPPAVKETATPTPTPPAPLQPAAEDSKGGSSFKPDPALMDFGQSSPEDEDLYSTRS